ncbi:cubilin-like [Babylonia areolata]|uniref:cubilin-like n=1 Tax=Babylonia areolata TaxID=304850 RepID=UPI003FD026F1
MSMFRSEEKVARMEMKQVVAAVLWLCYLVAVTEAVLSQRNCDLTVSARGGAAQNGTFESPGFPTQYPNNVHCLYKFVGKDNQRVQMRFTFFALQGRYPLCESDYVDVYAQLQDESEDLLDAVLFGRFCGESMDNLPKQKIISTGNVLIVSFFTDNTKTNRGFQASFEFFDDSEYDIGTKAPPILCGFTVRSQFKQSGYIVSPTYPGTYPDNQLCYYKLEGKVGERIRLRFQEFVLFHGGEYCPFDYVKIYDGPDKKSPVIGTFCGRYNSSTILYSTQEIMYLEFVTGQGRIEFGKPPIEQEADFSFERKGFNITYEFSSALVDLEFITKEAVHIPGTLCDQRILSTKESNGTIFSPNYPGDFPENIICHYYLDGLIDEQNLEKVEISFSHFNIPGNMPYCAIGYIGQQNDTVLGVGEVTERFCGSLDPPPLISKAARMVLVLNTYGSSQGGKFVARYKFIRDYRIPGPTISPGCKFYYGSRNSKKGTFNSPHYPAKYPFNTDCEYILRPEGNEMLVFYFHVLLFPDSQVQDPDCGRSDYVAIYEEIGERNNFTLTERYCNKALVPGPYATRRVVKVLFHSNNKDSNVGFKASYQFVSDGDIMRRCGPKEINGEGSGGRISSPNYPRKYSQLTVCDWILHASRSANKILLELTDLSMEGFSDNCQHSVLKVYDDRTAVRPLASVCGKSSEQITFLSAHASLRLRFISSPASLGARGFDLAWTEIHSSEPCLQFTCAVNNYCINQALKCDGQPNCGPNDDSDETAECPKSGGFQILHIAIGTSISSFFCIILLICGFYHRRKFRGSERAPPDHDHVEVRYVSAPTGCNTTDRLLMEERHNNDVNNSCSSATLPRGGGGGGGGGVGGGSSSDSPRCQKVSMV